MSRAAILAAVPPPPAPRHRRYRGRPLLWFRETHPTIAARLLIAGVMIAVAYLTIHHFAH